MSIMPSFNYHTLTLYSHGVITVLWHSQIFLCPANRGLTRVSCFDSFADGTFGH
jgi:lysophospholipid acyltransferase (LPLAT)-like uncharacterized protein